jgi:hypothetical protein
MITYIYRNNISSLLDWDKNQDTKISLLKIELSCDNLKVIKYLIGARELISVILSFSHG